MSKPNKVDEALAILANMESMVWMVAQSAGYLEQHREWFERVDACARDRSRRAQLAAELVAGPLEDFSDRDPSLTEDRRRALSSAVLEAALAEQEPTQTEAASLAEAHFDPIKLQSTLKTWIALGGWRAETGTPLTEIGRMIERSVEGVDDAVATRLGLVVPFWSSLALWMEMSRREEGGRSPGVSAAGGRLQGRDCSEPAHTD